MPTNFATGLEFSSAKWAVLVPMALMVIDILSGFINAWAKGDVKSCIMRQGLAKKFGEIVVLVIARIVALGFNGSDAFVYFCSIYVCLMEALSIVENLNKLGVPIPKWIKNALAKAANKADEGKEKKVNEDGTDSASEES